MWTPFFELPEAFAVRPLTNAHNLVTVTTILPREFLAAAITCIPVQLLLYTAEPFPSLTACIQVCGGTVRTAVVVGFASGSGGCVFRDHVLGPMAYAV